MEPGVLSPDGTGAFASPREYEKCQSRLVTKSGLSDMVSTTMSDMFGVEGMGRAFSP
jgi:hypothetical protein